MSNHADPWGLPVTPALSRGVYHRPSVVRTGAPERVYDEGAADPDWKPRPVGFTAHIGRVLLIEDEIETLLWEGED